MDTKACNLTEEEIKMLMNSISHSGDIVDKMERLNYFHKRLKAFNEFETKPMPTPTTQAAAWPSN